MWWGKRKLCGIDRRRDTMSIPTTRSFLSLDLCIHRREGENQFKRQNIAKSNMIMHGYMQYANHCNLNWLNGRRLLYIVWYWCKSRRQCRHHRRWCWCHLVVFAFILHFGRATHLSFTHSFANSFAFVANAWPCNLFTRSRLNIPLSDFGAPWQIHNSKRRMPVIAK